MKERLANVIYWAGCITAALSIIVFIIGTNNNNSGAIVPLFFGVPIWLLGWAFRYVLTGKKAIKP